MKVMEESDLSLVARDIQALDLVLNRAEVNPFDQDVMATLHKMRDRLAGELYLALVR